MNFETNTKKSIIGDGSIQVGDIIPLISNDMHNSINYFIKLIEIDSEYFIVQSNMYGDILDELDNNIPLSQWSDQDLKDILYTA